MMIVKNPIPEFLSHQKVLYRFNLDNYFPLNKVKISVVVVMDGDTHIQGDLDDWYEDLLKDNPDYDQSLMVIINGDLKVDGIATGKQDYNAHLFVIGDLYCDFLRSYDEVTWITGDAHVKYVFDGNYNDGCIDIKGVLNVPYLLNSDHASTVKPVESCVLIGYGGDDGNFNYDLTDDDYVGALIPELYSIKEDDVDLNRDEFYKVIKSGRSPFVEGYKIDRLVIDV